MSDLIGYEASQLASVEAILDGNPATAAEVYEASLPFSERALASVAALRAGAGGGSGIQTVTAILDNDAVKALPTGPYELLPTPAAGTQYLVHDWTMIVVIDSAVGHSYTNIGGFINILVGADVRRSGFLDSTTTPSLLDTVFVSSGTTVLAPSMTADPQLWSTGSGANAVNLFFDNVDNADDYNSVGAFTGGVAGNGMIVTVYYSIVELA